MTDQEAIDLVRREREREQQNKWSRRDRFALRVQVANQRAANHPETWIVELLETEAILG